MMVGGITMSHWSATAHLKPLQGYGLCIHVLTIIQTGVYSALLAESLQVTKWLESLVEMSIGVEKKHFILCPMCGQKGRLSKWQVAQKVNFRGWKGHSEQVD